MDNDRTPHGPAVTRGYVQRTLVVLALAALVFLLWELRQAIVLIFAAIVVAVILLAAVRPIEHRTALSHRWALAVVGVGILVVLLLFAWLLGSQVQLQFESLREFLSQAWQRIRETVGLPEMAGADGTRSGAGNGGVLGQVLASTEGLVSRAVSYGYLALEVVTTFVLVVIGGAFLASDPELYRTGLVKLFPPSRHAKIRETLDESGETLRKWLIAQLISMVIVGTLTGIGAWLIGLPAPLALGLIAGLSEFVPIIGPIASAISALLLATTEGWSMVLWTFVLYVAIQQLKSDVITPMVQQKIVAIPAGLILLAVTVFGLLFGVVGVIVASPLAIVTYVAVKKLYVADMLGEDTPMPTKEAAQD